MYGKLHYEKSVFSVPQFLGQMDNSEIDNEQTFW